MGKKKNEELKVHDYYTAQMMCAVMIIGAYTALALLGLSLFQNPFNINVVMATVLASAFALMFGFDLVADVLVNEVPKVQADRSACLKLLRRADNAANRVSVTTWLIVALYVGGLFLEQCLLFAHVGSTSADVDTFCRLLSAALVLGALHTDGSRIAALEKERKNYKLSLALVDEKLKTIHI